MGRRQIAITYCNPGTQPPVFVAGTFSRPEWDPQAMSVVADKQGRYQFEKVLSVDEGTEIQYKFRIGYGDCWALDENIETTSDDQGNVNNVIRIGTTPIDDEDLEDAENSPIDICPVFSHECFASHNFSSASSDSNDYPVDPLGPAAGGSPRFTNVDINDARIEHFPHNGRESIIAEIHKILTNTEIDRSIPEGVPPSPIVLPNSSSSTDAGPFLRRSSAPRASLGSFNSIKSHVSLASIQESLEDGHREPRQSASKSAGTRDSGYETGLGWKGQAIDFTTPVVIEQEGLLSQPTR